MAVEAGGLGGCATAKLGYRGVGWFVSLEPQYTVSNVSNTISMLGKKREKRALVLLLSSDE
jgi:hypothetical protein